VESFISEKRMRDAMGHPSSCRENSWFSHTPKAKPRGKQRSGPRAKCQHGIQPAKSEGLRKGNLYLAARAWLGITSRSHSGSAWSEIRGRRQHAVAQGQHRGTASIAPAAPSVCPCMDLVELTGSAGVWLPKTAWMAAASMRSLASVAVPWALM
jgi:hypothetical protein